MLEKYVAKCESPIKMEGSENDSVNKRSVESPIPPPPPPVKVESKLIPPPVITDLNEISAANDSFDRQFDNYLPVLTQS